MKKITLLFCFLFWSTISLAQDIAIPDSNFLSKLIESGVDTSNDGIIQQSEALAITYLDLGYAEIVNTAGIEYFNNVTFIDLNFNQVTAIDISSLQALVTIQLRDNELTQLDFSQNPDLSTIDIAGNPITEADLRVQSDLSLVLFENCDQLATVYLKNNAAEFLLTFNNCTSLEYICADLGDVPAIQNQMNTLGYTNVVVDSNCSLSAEDQEFSIKYIYPNPVREKLTISSAAAIDRLTIYDMAGQKISEVTPNNKDFTLDLAAYAKGIYIFETESKGRIERHKIIKD